MKRKLFALILVLLTFVTFNNVAYALEDGSSSVTVETYLEGSLFDTTMNTFHNGSTSNWSSNVWLDDVALRELVGTSYTTEQKDIDGYVFKTVTDNAQGVFKKGTIEVTYTYSKISKVTVHYINKDDNSKLDEDVEISGIVGDKYTTTEKEFEDYELVEVIGSKEGNFENEELEITYVYEFIGGIGNGDDPIDNPINEDINPKTGDNIEYYLLTTLISLLGIAFISKRTKYNN